MDYQRLLDAIQNDYNDFCDSRKLHKFDLNLQVRIGRKYAKICSDHGARVWGFVQLQDSDKFKKGDLLKAATWHAPAKNRARGNIITGDLSQVMYTGLRSLKKGAA